MSQLICTNFFCSIGKYDFDLILIQFDCSAVWIKYKVKLASAFRVDPLHLQHEKKSSQPVDFGH